MGGQQLPQLLLLLELLQFARCRDLRLIHRRKHWNSHRALDPLQIGQRTRRPRRMEEFTDLQKIAAIGGFGARANDCRGDLEKLLPSMCLAMPLPVFIPLKSAAAAEGFRNCLQWIIWPHEVFSSLYHNCRSAWNKYICPGTHEIQKFWAAMRSDAKDDAGGRMEQRFQRRYL